MNILPTDTSQLLESVRNFADHAHGEQMRKYTPERYIVHPERVMRICAEYTDNIAILSAALLHDVLEDTPVTKTELYNFLLSLMTAVEAEQTVKLVVELTDVFIIKDYPHLNRKQRKAKESERLEKTSGESQTIKYADIIDNSREIIQHDRSFARVFLFECQDILKRLNKGDQSLYKIAMDTVKRSINNINSKRK